MAKKTAQMRPKKRRQQSAPLTRPRPAYELIAERAYHIWQREGGSEFDCWVKAERELHKGGSSRAVVHSPFNAGKFEARRSATLAMLYAELAKAQAEQDIEGIEYVQETITEVLRPIQAGPIDEPLLDAFNKTRGRKAT